MHQGQAQRSDSAEPRLNYSRELVQRAVLQWLEDIRRDPTNRPDLNKVALPGGMTPEKYASLKARNLDKRRDGRGHIATACFVGYEALDRLFLPEAEAGRSRSNDRTFNNVCQALIATGRLPRQSAPRRYLEPPMRRPRAELMARAEELAFQGATRLSANPADAAIEHAKFAESCDRFMDDAMQARQDDIADIAYIIKANSLLRLGSDVCGQDNALTVEGGLSRIARARKHEGIWQAAALTEGKLLLELLPGVQDAEARLAYRMEAAQLMGMIRRPSMFPISVMLPGAANEVGHGVQGIDWGDAKRFPMTKIVFRPHRYQAATLMGAGVEEWLLVPHGRESIEKLLTKAEEIAELQTKLGPTDGAPHINIESTLVHVRYLAAKIRGLSGGEKPSASEKNGMAKRFDQLRSEAFDEGRLTAYDRSKYEALFALAVASLDRPKEPQFANAFLDRVLPPVRQSILFRPNTRNMYIEEPSFRLALWPYPELWKEFLRTCGFTDEEIALPSIGGETRPSPAI